MALASIPAMTSRCSGRNPRRRQCRSRGDSDQQLLRAAWAQPRALAGPPAMSHLCPLGVLTSLTEDQGPRQAQNPHTRSLHRPLPSGWLSTPTPTSRPSLTGHGTCPVLPCQCPGAGVFATYPSWSVSSLRWGPAQGQDTSVLKEHRAARVSTARVRGQGTGHEESPPWGPPRSLDLLVACHPFSGPAVS